VAETIAVLSQKGGTGKTTTVRTLTDVFRRLDLRVLAIDLDPQGNLSDYFDVDPEASPTVGDVLAGRAKARQADGVRVLDDRSLNGVSSTASASSGGCWPTATRSSSDATG